MIRKVVLSASFLVMLVAFGTGCRDSVNGPALDVDIIDTSLRATLGTCAPDAPPRGNGGGGGGSGLQCTIDGDCPSGETCQFYDRTDLCCCQVIGNAINQSEVPLNVTVSFDVFPAVGDPTVAVDNMDNVEPGENRQIVASGILMPCDDIDSFELRDLDLRATDFFP